MPVLKSLRRWAGTEELNATVPKLSPSCGPQETISPLFKSNELIAEDPVLLLLLQENNNNDKAKVTSILMEKG